MDAEKYDICKDSINHINEYDTIIFSDFKIETLTEEELNPTEHKQFDPEEYIDKHKLELEDMFRDLKHMSAIDGFANKANFSDFAEYIIISRYNKSDFVDWKINCDTYKQKYYNARKFTFKMYVQHFYEELLNHYLYFSNMYSKNLGYFKDWCYFCILHSNISYLN